jgi:hypothetical protein
MPVSCIRLWRDCTVSVTESSFALGILNRVNYPCYVSETFDRLKRRHTIRREGHCILKTSAHLREMTGRYLQGEHSASC